MAKFEVSDHTKLLSQLDNYNGRNVEYWNKGENK